MAHAHCLSNFLTKVYAHQQEEQTKHIFRWNDKIHVRQCNLNADAIIILLPFFSFISPSLCQRFRNNQANIQFSSFSFFSGGRDVVYLPLKRTENNFIIRTLSVINNNVHAAYTDVSVCNNMITKRIQSTTKQSRCSLYLSIQHYCYTLY